MATPSLLIPSLRVELESVVARVTLLLSCPLMSDSSGTMGGRPLASAHEVSQERALEWVAVSFSRGSSQPRDQTLVSSIGR